MAQRKKNRRFERRRVLHVKLRSSQRRAAWTRRLALFLLAIVGVGGGLYGGWHGIQQVWLDLVERNPYFTLEHLDIQTDGIVSAQQIQRWAGVEEGRNLFGLALTRIKRDLELVPAVRSASVERVLPDTLRVRVEERNPVARLMYPIANQPGAWRVILIDAEGFAMMPLEPGEVGRNGRDRDSKLPLLTGVPANRVRPGWPVVSERVAPALQWIRTFDDSPMGGTMRVAAVDVSAPGVLQVRAEDGCEISFGLSDFERQLRRWRAVREHAQRAGRVLAWLDLSVSNNVPVRWRG